MSNIELLDRRVASAFFGEFPRLREVQEETIQPLLAGRNMVLSAGTGSGKTEAVMTPLVSRYWRASVRQNYLSIIYVAPTRALVNDLEKRLYAPLESLGMRVGVRHGDRNDMTRRTKPHVLITTPESLDVLLFRGDEARKRVHALVIDEAHLLHNSQRGLQLSILIQRLRGHVTQPELQLCALSATIGSLQDIAAFLFGSVDNAEFLQFPSGRTIDAQVRVGGFHDIVRKLTLGRDCKLLAFVNRRKDCETLAKIRNHQAHLDASTFVHYSNLSQQVRVQTERKFANRKTALCIATGTLELGIDIGDIDAVLLGAVPSGIESFLQRIGRGNRRSNKTNAICFVGLEQELDASRERTESQAIEILRYLALIDAARRGELPQPGRYELFGAVAQQCLALLGPREGRFTRISELAKPFEHLDYLDLPTLKGILAALVEHGYVVRHQLHDWYAPGEGAHDLVVGRKIHGNFSPANPTLRVLYGSKVLGEISQFNISRMSAGSAVRFAGRLWRVVKIGDNFIRIEPARGDEPKGEISYSGAGKGFDAFLTDRMWRMVHQPDLSLTDLTEDLREWTAASFDRIRGLCGLDQIPYHVGPNKRLHYFTFGGYLVNKAIALFSEQDKYDAGDCGLSVGKAIDWSSLPTDPQGYAAVFEEMYEKSLSQSIFQSLLPQEIQMLEFLQEWLKDGAIRQVLARLAGSTPVQVTTALWDG